ncbi:RagB/SusD family nutrient uptake outer membrane protein [Adhaeribacter arboris]|uniref:RagB/SusD family nutrient uptake outer membrane protein n=1 Tax=Adhaeribacter arboris TaxID=2072846 RepID=A0A2T2YGS8_9BACT|nr:RagB/SusD family nutrient uptake outer membrane protein [Adhaeribacter arboris]PSR54721.1 RagB/SusD family nutrient uptake outer membrane protein [Adhaeribacter arboris]
MIHKYIFAGALVALALFSGCSDDFLERPPLDTLTSDTFYNTDAQVLASTAPLYNVVWKSYHDQASFHLGDVRGGTTWYPWGTTGVRENVLFRTSGVTQSSLDAYQAFYNVIGQSNMAIYNINRLAGPEVSEAVKNQAIAEARFMRATAYTYLVMNFGEVPIITNNIEEMNNADIVRNTIPSIWEFITRDYLFAAENLPLTVAEAGRLTKWSAEGMLARTYLTRAGVGQSGGNRDQALLDKAKEYADRVIKMSGKQLVRPYENLFKYPYDNNSESLFELEWATTNNYDASNTQTSQITPFAEIAVNNDGWGGSFGATYWMLSLYDGLIDRGTSPGPEDDGVKPGFTTDQRLKASYMLPGAVYPEIKVKRAFGPNKAGDVLTVPDPGTADLGSVFIKKYVVGNDLNGVPATQQRYPHNNYMLRLAEMYLIYVEAAVGNNESTTDPTAVGYFNVIRNRAGLPNIVGPIRMNRTWSADPTVYKDDVLEERAKEFAMEGMTWYDLVRIHYYNPEKAYAIINNQDRGGFVAKPDRFPNPTGWTFTKTAWFTDRNAVVNSGNFYLQIPSVEISQAPNLTQPAVDYVFGE